MYSQETLESQPVLLLDPTKFSEDGTSSLNTYSLTESGKLLAYGISQVFYFNALIFLHYLFFDFIREVLIG